MASLKSVLEKAGVDRSFRERLKASPTAVLAEAGAAVPAGTTVEVIEPARQEVHPFLGRRCGVAEVDRVLDKASQDAAFRARLQGDPRGVLQEATGANLPADVQVRIHDFDARRLPLVLPPMQEGDELSDLELESVTGAGTGLGHKILRGLGNAWDTIRDVTCKDHHDPSSGAVCNSAEYSIGNDPH